MSTYTQILYHIVFSTKSRTPVLVLDNREALFRYIWGIVKKKNCHLHRINGTEDHLHILTSLHPCECPADFVRDIKTGASQWIKGNNVFQGFVGWQEGLIPRRIGGIAEGCRDRVRREVLGVKGCCAVPSGPFCGRAAGFGFRPPRGGRLPTCSPFRGKTDRQTMNPRELRASHEKGGSWLPSSSTP